MWDRCKRFSVPTNAKLQTPVFVGLLQNLLCVVPLQMLYYVGSLQTLLYAYKCQAANACLCGTAANARARMCVLFSNLIVCVRACGSTGDDGSSPGQDGQGAAAGEEAIVHLSPKTASEHVYLGGTVQKKESCTA
jgi:hypothetical protein